MSALASRHYLAVDEVAELLGKSEDTVRRLIAAGHIPAARLGNGPWLIDENALAELLKPTSSARANPDLTLRADLLDGSARALDAETEEGR